MKPLINLKGRPSPFFYLFFLPSACSIPFGIVPRFSRRPFCTGRHRKLDRARSRHRDSRPPARAAPIKVASPTACLGGFASLRHSSLRGPAASRPPLSARLIGRESAGRARHLQRKGRGDQFPPNSTDSPGPSARANLSAGSPMYSAFVIGAHRCQASPPADSRAVFRHLRGGEYARIF